MPGQSNLGCQIRRLRDAAGFTLAELSARTGMREAYLEGIERGDEEPSAAALKRLVDQLEPAGARYKELAGFLAAPEFDPSGEYVHAGSSSSQDIPKPIVSGTAATGDPHNDAPVKREDLQFDRAVMAAADAAGVNAVGVTCELCQQSIDIEYYDVNAKVLCGRCRAAVEAAAEVPSGVVPLAVAGAFGLGAAVAGAILYYAILALAHLQIGYVAILIGYIVGYAVRRGARGRGGVRFQVLAVVLTYASIALAYTPIAVGGAIDVNRKAQAARPGGSAPVESRPITKPTASGAVFAVILLFALIAILPVLVIVGSFPSGLITAFIIFIGMRQAWKMTAAVQIQVLGPYKVGPALSAQI